jgi:ribosomal protein S18 acetylase RimI-like enzyme
MSVVTLRDATPDDAIEIAAVWVASLRATFTGLISPQQLEAYTQMNSAVDVWRRQLNDNTRHTTVALADGVLCGLAEWTPMPGRPLGQAPLSDFDGYLYHLYVLAVVQRQGIGRRLMAAAARSLREHGCSRMALHVLATNPAVAFYERLGGTRVRTDPAAGGTPLPHHVYGWSDLAGLDAGA